MINKKRIKNKSKLPLIILMITILIFTMYITYNSKLLKNIHMFFNNIGYKLESLLIIKIPQINNNILIGIDDELLKENIELKNLLNLKNDYYNMVTCNVIKRDIDWFNTITINKGKKNNIDINMAVIDSIGLIGRISEVGEDYSIVELISNNNSKISVSINDIYGILDSYDKDNSVLIVKNVNNNNNIEIGNKVYTNGIGGIYPAGIYIGDVIDIISDKEDLSKILKVSVSNNFNNIRYVNVIRR